MSELKREFLEEFLRAGANRSEVCERWGVSRKHGYALARRYREEGEAALYERSRRPRRSPHQSAPEVEAAVLEVRSKHPTWGARKIARKLRDRGTQGVPAFSTITAILQRHEQIPKEASQKRQAFVRFERARPNELWQMDFKGHFGLRDGQRCHPLLLLDDHSRYCLAVRALENEQGASVQTVLREIFRESGLPEGMLMDNGSPWGQDREHVYTPLVVWLLRLGIAVSHGRPRHPQTQGKLERLNRTLQEELLARASFWSSTEAQQGFDTWRPQYNHERPHEALDMQVPASRWRASARSLPEPLPAIEYEAADTVRRVQQGGRLSYLGREYCIPKAFAGQPVALRASAQDAEMAVYFCHQRVALLDLSDGTARLVRG